MLIQDSLTGRLQEIPRRLYGPYLGGDGSLYEQRYPQGYGYAPQQGAVQVVYDGLGNPIGMIPLLAALAPVLAPLVAKVAPRIIQKVLPSIAPKVAPVINQLLPAVANLFQDAAPMLSQAPMEPMMNQQVAPTPDAPIPASTPAPAQAPPQRVMAPPMPTPGAVAPPMVETTVL